jgi:outer membrane receptor protein involved in Fe transport
LWTKHCCRLRTSGLLTLGMILSFPTGSYSQTPANTPVQGSGVTVNVVGATPLPGVNLDRNEIPAPIQSATSSDIQDSGASDLSDFLNLRFAGIHINEMQGNPFQADVNYRGYTASPLLGTPQGLSVYMDGVRLNQPFGDVVSWDLIPQIAISSTALMPGSNPLFGLNTLGGALSLQTKDGRHDPGFRMEASYGSHARRSLQLEYGGASAKGLSWYLAGNWFGESGWRNNSHTDVRQEFGRFGWLHGKTDLKLTLAYANNALAGNGLQEQRFLARDYASIYTKPDLTYNRSAFTNLNLQHSFSSKLMLSGNGYYRDIRVKTLNADINDDSLDQSLYQPSAADQAALTAAGYTGFPTSGANSGNTPFPFWRCIAQALQRDEPGEKCNGLINQSRNTQHNYGMFGQLTWLGTPSGHDNQFTVGGGYDHSSVGFAQSTQLGYLNPDRSVTGVNAFADGVTGGIVDGEPLDNRVDLDGHIHTWSVYATDTLAVGTPWRFTVSGRYNRTLVRNEDNINPGGGPGSLDGENLFERLNPAAGVTFSPSKLFNFYFGYSQGSRAPTSVELGCADPDEPCKLPNAMAGDPPLEQVVARTWEGGVRSGTDSRVNWNMSLFRADNHNDILFVTSTQSGFGYFKNFGSTRRQGVEAGVSGEIRFLSAGANYTYLAATYESAETLSGAGNSSNDGAMTGGKGLDGVIEIAPGDRIPLIPRHTAKLFTEFKITKRFSVSPNMVAVSSALARGNENDLHQPDGVVYLGPGRSPGYALVNVSANYHLSRKLDLFAQLNNLLDHRYYSAAQLGATGFTSTGSFIARPFPPVSGEFPVQQATFLSPGAPTIFWIGTRLRF